MPGYTYLTVLLYGWFAAMTWIQTRGLLLNQPATVRSDDIYTQLINRLFDITEIF